MNSHLILEKLREQVLPERTQRFQEVLEKRTRMIKVVVEDLYYEHNSSAVFRTCDCFGVQDVAVIESKYKSRVTEIISKGAEKWLTVDRYEGEAENTSKCIKDLKHQGYQIVATSPHEEDIDLQDFEIDRKTAIVFGSEENGLSQEMFDAADVRLRVPIYGFTESYNISVCAALILQQLVQKLHQSDLDWELLQEEKIAIETEWILTSIGRGSNLIYERIQKEVGS